MLSNRKKYKTLDDAMDRWRDYMVSMGFGYKLGIDLPGEKRGLIPNADGIHCPLFQFQSVKEKLI